MVSNKRYFNNVEIWWGGSKDDVTQRGIVSMYDNTGNRFEPDEVHYQDEY